MLQMQAATELDFPLATTLPEEVAKGPWIPECAQQLRDGIHQHMSKCAVVRTPSGRRALQTATCMHLYLPPQVWDVLTSGRSHIVQLSRFCPHMFGLGISHPAE